MQITILGGGMIAHDQILPSFYQLRRLGLVEQIVVCARHAATLDALAASEHPADAILQNLLAVAISAARICRPRNDD